MTALFRFCSLSAGSAQVKTTYKPRKDFRVWLCVLTAYKRPAGAYAGSAKVSPSIYITLSETSAVLHASQNMTVHCSIFCSAPASQDLKTSQTGERLLPIPFMVRCGINRVIHQQFISMIKWALSPGSGRPREISTCLSSVYHWQVLK